MPEVPAAPKLHIWQLRLAPEKSSVPSKPPSPFPSCYVKPSSGSLQPLWSHAIMRIATISLGLLALLTPLTAAWSKEGESTP